MRKLLILALSLLSFGGLTSIAAAHSLSIRTSAPLANFEADCDARYGDLTVLHNKATCELPSGHVLTLRLAPTAYDYSDDYDYAPQPSISIILGEHHHHCQPLKEQAMTLGMSGGNCRPHKDKPSVMSKPIEMGSGNLKEKPALKGLFRH